MKLDGMHQLHLTFYDINNSLINLPAFYYSSKKAGRIPTTYVGKEVFIRENGRLIPYTEHTVYFVQVVG